MVCPNLAKTFIMTLKFKRNRPDEKSLITINSLTRSNYPYRSKLCRHRASG